MASKRQRRDTDIKCLQQVLHLGGISNSGLQTLLVELQRSGTPSSMGSHVMDEAYHAKCLIERFLSTTTQKKCKGVLTKNKNSVRVSPLKVLRQFLDIPMPRARRLNDSKV